MIYATPAQMETYLGEEAYLRLADRDASGSADVADVEAACANASSLADSYIAKWIPALIAAAAVPALLTQHVLNLAVYLIAGNNFTKDQRKRYDDAIAWLESVKSGDVTLDVPPVGDGGASSGFVRIVSSPRVMRRCQLGELL